ncbi:MAG: glutamine--fructose-6-phosphate transaminase (isomerizing) [Oscillospiraceae bacterium]|jgi:glucosamine--fructose-6-phosphate aminotransferase (isomerizing)|nr:glutamine--fructose-6-phosphate transaminase (isomerizing) [Oscillospiraceae bacterium]
MCGIVGFTGSRAQAAPICLDALTKLEYRGYDSAGICVLSGGKFNLIKAKGYVKILAEKTDDGRRLPGTTGIGHTRWATHGEPNETNAHPHISSGGLFSIVHNGIIENYAPLREFLISRGYEFSSATDTEVAASAIEFFFREVAEEKPNEEPEAQVVEAIARAARRMTGSYAFGILYEKCPDRIFAAKRESPLYIGLSPEGQYLTSDIAAFLHKTREFITLADHEIALISPNGTKVFSGELDELDKKPETIDWDVEAAGKAGYEHFMIKEIFEQPEAVKKTVSGRIKNGRVVLDGLDISEEYIKNISRIYITACGTASYVGVAAKYNIERYCRIPVEVVIASEFRYSDPIIDETTLVIAISQSGTTADTIAAVREAKRRGARVLSIVNVVGSVIATESDWTLLTLAGPEICVASTKAYSTQLAVSYLIALRFAEVRGTISDSEYAAIVADLQRLPEVMKTVLELKGEVSYLASRYFIANDVFFIGRNIDYALTLEGSLKLKEISYIHSESYAAGELKHGPIALIEDGTLVVTVATYAPLAEKTVSNAVEVKSRGARILALATEKTKDCLKGVADNVIVIPDIHEALLPSLAVVPLQMFAYYIALGRGCEIDKPRNLAKSVTVE